MSQVLTLTDPIVTTRATYAITFFNVRDWQAETPTITVGIIGSDGVEKDFLYRGDAAAARLAGLNTANFSAYPLEQALLEMLMNDGHIPPGTVTGTPR